MKKSEKYAWIGTSISVLLIVLMLLFIFLPGNALKEEGGLMISFGNASDGAGTRVETPAPAKQSEIRDSKDENDDVLTQKDPSLSISEKKKKTVSDVKKIENDRLLAERKRKEQDAIDKANSMDGLFGNNTSGGSGNTSGDSQQGNPAGKGSQGGNSWSLGGRDLSGELVSPSYEKNVEGRVTVQIRVDERGRVIGATIASNTTISDATTRNAAIAAAKNTRFTPGSGISTGTITYNFKLR